MVYSYFEYDPYKGKAKEQTREGVKREHSSFVLLEEPVGRGGKMAFPSSELNEVVKDTDTGFYYMLTDRRTKKEFLDMVMIILSKKYNTHAKTVHHTEQQIDKLKRLRDRENNYQKQPTFADCFTHWKGIFGGKHE